MPVTTIDTVDHRTEKALAAYIRGYRDNDSDDETYELDLELDCDRAGELKGIPVHEGRQTTQRGYPSIIVSAPQYQRLYQGADWFQVTATVELHTHRNESEDQVKRAEIVHARRCKALEDLIGTPELVKDGMNAPEPPEEDARDVQHITVMGADLISGFAEVANGAFVQRFEVLLTVAPWDKAPG